MKQEVRQEILDNQRILDLARDNIIKAWVAGNIQEHGKWEHYAAVVDARISYLYSIINKGA